jgi:hypothetical protein
LGWVARGLKEPGIVKQSVGRGAGGYYFPGLARGIVVVRMKIKVTQFPQRPGHAAIPIGEPLIIFSLGRKRVAVQWTATLLRDEPAKVIPIQKESQRKDGNAKRRSK